ncbi:hypothetical protein BZG35_16355 [Brevundimonas sp. LM2]|uniref:cytochrome b n=1 Tax=Brevundimonas sp. LM2 TaxID=1938605 RepID=UPI000983A191|nr:cytochrome b [Brevundimonas sp. LM2]AQR63054.1 hypothetical protein BZG35_16355 [Brevundimonas sp. LM2]
MTPPQDRFTRPAIWLHWITALLMIFMLLWGEDYIRRPEGASLAGWQPSTHATIGVLILLLGIARLLWRMGNPPPKLPRTMRPWEAWAAKATHSTFYVFLIALPVTGLLAIVPYGIDRLDVDQVRVFGLFPVAFLPNLGDLTGNVHTSLTILTKALVVVHVLAALKHQFWDKDGLLGRMRPV